jgi:hypothetical protein
MKKKLVSYFFIILVLLGGSLLVLNYYIKFRNHVDVDSRDMGLITGNSDVDDLIRNSNYMEILSLKEPIDGVAGDVSYPTISHRRKLKYDEECRIRNSLKKESFGSCVGAMFSGRTGLLLRGVKGELLIVFSKGFDCIIVFSDKRIVMGSGCPIAVYNPLSDEVKNIYSSRTTLQGDM